MTNATPGNRSARERLLAAADELFYHEGVHTVGIDRVIAHAGVAKASLYKAFGSKEELIKAYLQRRQEGRQQRLMQTLAHYATPRERLLGVFDALAERATQAGFHGCAFINASAESKPGSSVETACDSARSWMKQLFLQLSEQCAVADAPELAQRLVLLYDGALVAAKMDRNPAAAHTAKAVASALLAAAVRCVPARSVR